MKDTYLNLKDITDSLKINQETLKKWIAEGKFPPPMRINDRVTIWSYAGSKIGWPSNSKRSTGSIIKVLTFRLKKTPSDNENNAI